MIESTCIQCFEERPKLKAIQQKAREVYAKQSIEYLTLDRPSSQYITYVHVLMCISWWVSVDVVQAMIIDFGIQAYVDICTR